MFKSSADNWNQVREMFAAQFELDGTNLIYRRSQTGEAIRVSPEERSQFLDDFECNVRRSKWLIYVGLTLVLGGTIAFSLIRDADVPSVAMVVGIVLAMIPYSIYNRWAWAAPARQLAGRTPIAGERSPEDVRRLRFQHTSYGQLAGGAFGGLAIGFFASSGQGASSGWSSLGLAFGAALVLLAAVQAFRKWRFEQSSSFTNDLSTLPRANGAGSTEASAVPAKGRLWGFAPFVVLMAAIAFVAYTPTGKQLARTPYFWTAIMLGFGAWSIAAAVLGLTRGQVTPLISGHYKSYQREAQPKRFWASMTWNILFGVLCIWLGLKFGIDTRTRQIEDPCFKRRGTPAQNLAACDTLVKQRPNESDAYFHRGLAYLGSSNFDRAIGDFSEAHRLAPKLAWPLANRGLAYAWKNDEERAKRDFELASRIDPANPVVLHGEAMLSMYSGDLDQAIAKLTAALVINAKDGWALQTRADAYQQRGDFALAKADRDRFRQLAARAKAASSTP